MTIFENILDYLRIALYVALFMLAFLLYQAWNKEHTLALSSATQTQLEGVPSSRYAPELGQPNTAAVPQTATQVNQVNQVNQTNQPSQVAGKPLLTPPSVQKGQLIEVKTDVLQVTIDTQGGDIITSKLLKYPETLDSPTPYLLLNDEAKTRYIAESGLLSKEGPDTSQAQAVYTTTQSRYDLSSGEEKLAVNLQWENAQGLHVTKKFIFTRGSYEVEVAYDIANASSQAWQGNMYTQLLRTNAEAPDHGGLANLATFFGAAISSPQKPFQKISFKQMQEQNINQTVQDGWAAMVQHYFVSAWIPAKTSVSNYYSRVTPNGLYAIGMVGPEITVQAGGNASTAAKLYTGPALTDRLEKAAPGLRLTIDYGWFWFISDIIFWMMQKIYDLIGNWGWSIVIVTVIIKLLFYKLSAKSYRSMSGLKKLQPRIEALKERFGTDKQKLTQATLELYRQEKVNPMSGCLPILIQIPVFIALYWVLAESVQLRQAPFIFWIRDLSHSDPYYVLPLLMGISMFLQQRLNPPPPDPLQAKLMMLMPVIFTALFFNFPAGLMLYWFVNNMLSFLQQWYIMHKLEKEESMKRVRS